MSKTIIIDGVEGIWTPSPKPLPELESELEPEFWPGEQMFEGRWFPVRFEPDNIPVQYALTDQDILDVAAQCDVPAAHVDAVRRVEAGDSGFLLNEDPPARPKILFEGHWFYRLTPKAVSKVRPDLSHPKWTKQYYKGGSAEWGRLQDACGFDFHNALKSASWGLGQVMGFNYELAGCASVEEFVAETFSGEAAQFAHMINFIDSNDLMDDLRRGDWRGFAKGYNGAGYEANAYHTRLARAAADSKFA
jgi:hypothetical protein